MIDPEHPASTIQKQTDASPDSNAVQPHRESRTAESEQRDCSHANQPAARQHATQRWTVAGETVSEWVLHR